MKLTAFNRRIAIACTIAALSYVCSFAQVALRRPISADNPLIIANTNLRMLTPGSGNEELHDVWNAIPADMKPYCALNADPMAIKPSEAEVEAWVSACEAIGAFCMLQAQQCNMAIYDSDGAIVDRLMKKYPHFLGYQWCEFQWGPVNFPGSNVNVFHAQLAKIAQNGGYFLMADMGGNIWNDVGSSSSVVNSMRQYKSNVIVLDKMTQHEPYYWNQSAVIGFWLAGIAGNYGVSPDSWIWENSPQQGMHTSAPIGIQAMMIEKSAAVGATVYLKFECMNSSDLTAVHYPLLRKIIKNKMTPTLAEVKSQIKVGHKYNGAMNQNLLCGGLYLNNIWMPTTSRYGIVPVFPQQATSAETNFCEIVTLNQFSSDAARKTFYDQRYPDNDITGNSYVVPYPLTGCAMFANPNETNQSGLISTFTFPLKRNSCQSLSGTLASYTYGTIEEAPDSIGILVGNYMGASTLPRSNITTFVLKGISETQEPPLVISGQTSYTKSWNATTQEYTLAITHNGTVNITLWTSGGTKPPTMICSPSSLNFTVDSGSAPITQNLALKNIGAGTLGAASVRRIVYGAGASSWLSTSITGIGNNQQIAVQATSGTLPKGTYKATLVIESAATKPDSLVCPVTLEITRLGRGAINAGGGAVAQFEADSYSGGGVTSSTTTPVSISGVTNAAPAEVYKTERYGAMTYTIPSCVPGASYTLRLHFAETYWTAATKRIFNVLVNGAPVLTNFDIFTAAGGAFKAVVKDFTATANGSGQIVVDFVSVVDQAKISALEWFPSATQVRSSGKQIQTAELFTAQFDKTKHLQIQVNQPGNHTVRIATVNGATVKVFAGVGRQVYRLDAHAVSGGMYVVNVVSHGRHQSACVVARE